MTEMNERQELNERLELIEGMIGEGRRTTARWGWVFVLWGVAYLVAIAWTASGHGVQYAWPVTMTATAVINGVYGSRVARRAGGARTTIGRAMAGIWTSMGLSLFMFGFAEGASRHADPHALLAGFEIILGMGFMASSIVLRWKVQFACAVLWWATAMVALFGTLQQARVGFIAGTGLCMIAFGIYAMVREGGCQGNVVHV